MHEPAVARLVPYERGRNSRVTGQYVNVIRLRESLRPYCSLPGRVATPRPHGAGAAARRSGRFGRRGTCGGGSDGRAGAVPAADPQGRACRHGRARGAPPAGEAERPLHAAPIYAARL